MQLNLALKSANAPQAPFKSEIWTIPVEEQDGQLKAGTAEKFLKDEFNDIEPAFSPDGRWLAYTSDESGKNEVYVRPFPPEASAQRGKASISNQGGGSPRWSPPPSHDLLYRAADGSVMVVTFRVKGDTFVPDKPRMWGPARVNGAFDLSPDGKRLVVVVSPPGLAPTGRAPEHEVVFLQNFFDELRRRAPLSK
jgi:serine/threonine-protein kinase